MRICKIGFFLMASLFLFTSVSFGADVAKIGLIDFQRILSSSNAGKAAKAQISKQGRQMEEDLKQKGAEIETLKRKMEQEAVLMDKAMREEKERELRIKINDFRGLQKKYDKELQNFQKRVLVRLRKEIIDISDEIGKKEGYLLIMEKAVVIYSPSTMDLTDQVIQRFNEKYAEQAKDQTNN